jgi:hypothetical protein
MHHAFPTGPAGQSVAFPRRIRGTSRSAHRCPLWEDVRAVEALTRSLRSSRL